jgi:hypothetical protein
MATREQLTLEAVLPHTGHLLFAQVGGTFLPS